MGVFRAKQTVAADVLHMPRGHIIRHCARLQQCVQQLTNQQAACSLHADVPCVAAPTNPVFHVYNGRLVISHGLKHLFAVLFKVLNSLVTELEKKKLVKTHSKFESETLSFQTWADKI